MGVCHEEAEARDPPRRDALGADLVAGYRDRATFPASSSTASEAALDMERSSRRSEFEWVGDRWTLIVSEGTTL